MKKEKKITEKEFISVLRDIFDIGNGDVIDKNTDVTAYIKDSIDLGELLAVIKHKYDVGPNSTEPFLEYTKLKDVIRIINNEDII